MLTKFATSFHRSLFANALVIVASMVLGCSTSKPNTPQAPLAKVTVATAIEQKIIDYEDFVGRTEASETAEVRSRVSGFVKSVETLCSLSKSNRKPKSFSTMEPDCS